MKTQNQSNELTYKDIKEKYCGQLPEVFLKEYYEDLEERVYYLDYESIVQDEGPDLSREPIEIVKRIIRYNKEDMGLPINQRKPFKIFINSCGGSVTSAWSVIQAIKISKTPVWTINMSVAYSAASEILAAGQKRFALKGSTCMIHKGSTFISGENSVVESTQKFYSKMDKLMQDALFEETAITPAFYKKKASSDIYFNDEEMLEYKIVDKIVEDFEEII